MNLRKIEDSPEMHRHLLAVEGLQDALRALLLLARQERHGWAQGSGRWGVAVDAVDAADAEERFALRALAAAWNTDDRAA